MFEVYVIAFTTYFATVGPLDVAAMFAVLTATASTRTRRILALRGTAIATAILIIFALCGNVLLAGLGISLAALKVAGGILLLLMGIEMVFARSSGGTSTTSEETVEASTRPDISVFPLATPLIAGPGAIGASILLMTKHEGDTVAQGMVMAGLFTVMLVTLILLLLAESVPKIFGVTGMHVVGRIFGVLLSALAVQFIFDGIAASGIFPAPFPAPINGS